MELSALSNEPCLTDCNMQGKERKAFVQSFFLATQERGYFVLNDTFRYLAEPAKAFAADFATPDVVTHGASQQYGAHHEVGCLAKDALQH